jgi:RNA polymerase sigma-70 factor (ECF subfamily)
VADLRTSAVQPDVEETALLERLRAGEEAAFEELVRTNTGRLLAVARRLLPTEEDARDVVQEAFLSAFRSLPRFAGGSKLSTWLHRIVVNAALMRLRTRRRRPEESLDALLPAFLDDGHHAESFSGWSEPADRALERTEVRELVRTQIERLPETYRTVLMLRDIEGMETEDVAAALDLTPNAVKMRLHRGRQALRTLLAPIFKRETR